MTSPQHPTTIENLPGDVLRNILIRLPAKPLAQMRCVSKPWNAILSQPSFIKSHLHHSIHNNDSIVLVVLKGSYKDPFAVTAHISRSVHHEIASFIDFPAIPPSAHDSVKIFGSVNGLICLCYPSYDDLAIHIWNPSLSAVSTLPPSVLSFRSSDLSQMHFRFGFDPKTDDYKLIKLMNGLERPIIFGDSELAPTFRSNFDIVKERLLVEVYSMKKGSWELITHSFPSNVDMISDEYVLCVDGHDGHLHWLGYTCINNKMERKRQTIVAFDLGDETFSEICLPDSLIDYDYCRRIRLGVIHAKLCVISFSMYFGCEVWVMNENGVAGSWVKHHDFSDLVEFLCGMELLCGKEPFGFTLHNEFLFGCFDGSLGMYDPIASVVKSCDIMAGQCVFYKILQYIDSLVWVAPARRGIGCYEDKH